MSCGAGNLAAGLCQFCRPTHLGGLDARFCREYGRYPCRQPQSRRRGKRARRIRGGTAALRRLTILPAPALTRYKARMPEPSSSLPVTPSDIDAAARVVARFAVRTPLLSSPVLDERVGTKVFLKAEMLQRTGSFKFRGAFNRLSAIPQDSHGGGVVAYSSGNHAQRRPAAGATLHRHSPNLS